MNEYSVRLDQTISCAIEHQLCRQLGKSQLIWSSVMGSTVCYSGMGWSMAPECPFFAHNMVYNDLSDQRLSILLHMIPSIDCKK
ncbi:MAG: hypothetical protein JWQ79_2027 [Mucilaginibacter sp.]|nr:hypothetical protein [Mucilaginibacter sp.]